MRTFYLSLGVFLCLGLFMLGCQKPSEPAGGTTDAAEESTETPHDPADAAGEGEVSTPAASDEDAATPDESSMSVPAAGTETAADETAADDAASDDEGEVRIERVFGFFGKAAVETAQQATSNLPIPAPPVGGAGGGGGGYPADAPPAPAFNP